MSKIALALAAALFAGTTMTNAAEANGIRLGFGMPLGSFVASPFSSGARQQSYSRGPSNYERMCAQREAKARAAKIAAAKRQAAGKQYAAQQEAAARRQAVARAEAAEARARKAQTVAKAPVETRDAEIQTAKVTSQVETKQVVTEAAPAIFVPNTPAPVAAAAPVAEPLTTAALTEAGTEADETEEPAQQVVTVDPPAPVTVIQNTETKTAEKTSSKLERVCRRFSAVIGGLVDFPCE